MIDRWLRRMVRGIPGTAGAGGAAGLTDAEILERFLTARDEAAFELLVRRHGPMVLQTCQRLLRHAHDAEDAFQATFLTLALKGRSIGRRESLAGWLFRVAYRVALRIRSLASRRPAPTGTLPEAPAPAAEAEWLWREVRGVLDDEVHRLPEPFHGAFVLCCLEGRTNAEAARELGCSPGTVASRVSRARERLRARLRRRGVTLSVGALAAVLSHNLAAATVPVALLNATLSPLTITKLAAFAGISPQVAALSQGVIQAMFFAKLKTAVLVAFVSALLLGGAVLASRTALVAGTDAQAGRPDEEPKLDHKARLAADLTRMYGDWRVVEAVRDGRALPGIGGKNHLCFSRNALYIRYNPNEFHDPYFDFRIDPSKTPATIDLTDGADLRFHGIYKIDGEKLTLCWNTEPGAPRPAAFSVKPGSKHHLVSLIRSDWEKIRGDWRLVSGEVEGVALQDRDVQAFRLQFPGSKLILATRQRTLEGWEEMDEHVSPRTIALTLELPRRGKEREEEKWAGIYELDGNRLTMCLGPTDNPPKTFATAPGTGHQLYVMQREKKENKQTEPKKGPDKGANPGTNPRYNAWVGQEGKAERFQRELRISGGPPPGTERVAEQTIVTYALTELTPEKALIKISTKGKDEAKTLTIPASCAADDPGCPKAAGEEEIQIGKRKYKCKVFRYQTKSEAEAGLNCQGIPARITIWMAPDVPGGVVRRRVELTIKASYVVEETRVNP